MRDVALIGGLNFDGDANVLKWLPGARLSWDVPGFIFLNTDFIDASSGLEQGGTPKTTDSFMFDVSSGAVSISKGVRLFLVGGPRGFGERHGKSHLTRRRRGGEVGAGGSLTGGAIPSAYRWAWFRWNHQHQPLGCEKPNEYGQLLVDRRRPLPDSLPDSAANVSERPRAAVNV